MLFEKTYIDKIPNELLVYIFKFVFDQNNSPNVNLSLVNKHFNYVYNLTIKTYEKISLEKISVRNTNRFFKKAVKVNQITFKNMKISNKLQTTNLIKFLEYRKKSNPITSLTCKYSYDYYRAKIKDIISLLSNLIRLDIDNDNFNSFFNNWYLVDLVKNNPKIKHISINSFNKLDDLLVLIKPITLIIKRGSEFTIEKIEKNLIELQCFYIDCCNVNTYLLLSMLIKNCHNLRQLVINNIHDQPKNPDEDYKLLMNLFVVKFNITILELTNNSNITNEIVEIIGSKLTKLTELNLNVCKNITGECLKYLNLENMLSLELSEIKDVNDEHFSYIYNAKKIKTLVIRIDNVSNVGLGKLLTSCDNLTRVIFYNAHRINNVRIFVYFLLKHHMQMREFRIMNANISAKIILVFLLRKFPKLKSFRITNIMLKENNQQYFDNFVKCLNNFIEKNNIESDIYLSFFNQHFQRDYVTRKMYTYFKSV